MLKSNFILEFTSARQLTRSISNATANAVLFQCYVQCKGNREFKAQLVPLFFQPNPPSEELGRRHVGFSVPYTVQNTSVL